MNNVFETPEILFTTSLIHDSFMDALIEAVQMYVNIRVHERIRKF